MRRSLLIALKLRGRRQRIASVSEVVLLGITGEQQVP